jgi:hypothetical protein
MAKKVGKAVASSKKVNGGTSNSGQVVAPGYKKQFTVKEKTEIQTKRREMRARLFAAG